ncbi:energy transducer TonB [Gramella lutea]|uniref:Energy transducer TonB n=1 Tax=Christiangramia lutea TaxID=1607951 RepID=A0A9X1V0J3_9FLAO|nr:energy transducer TonB [Christiangramia lutea]MCH4822052.1 energy transducer TonB [Christiangramia lutea]
MKQYTLSLIFALIGITGFGQETDALPFEVVDRVPGYPGCEELQSAFVKDCTVQKISNFVNKNFDTSLGKELKIEGVTRIVVQFKIDENGKVTNVRSRSMDEKAEVRKALQAEANRVVSSLPQMQPAQNDGKNVAIMYSLPIALAAPNIDEEKEEINK